MTCQKPYPLIWHIWHDKKTKNTVKSMVWNAPTWFCHTKNPYDTIWHFDKATASLRSLLNPSQKSPDKSGLYLFAVIVFCFSYCSKRKLSIDFISSIYKFFSSPLSKLFFFFNSSFFFKVSFVLVFSRICWKRSNVSSKSRYNWL